jgi:hypothetical protein
MDSRRYNDPCFRDERSIISALALAWQKLSIFDRILGPEPNTRRYET